MSDVIKNAAETAARNGDGELTIEAVKAAIIEDITEATWQKIRQLGGLKLYLVGPDDVAEQPAPTPPKKRAKEEPRHVSDDEWHSMHP